VAESCTIGYILVHTVTGTLNPNVWGPFDMQNCENSRETAAVD